MRRLAGMAAFTALILGGAWLTLVSAWLHHVNAPRPQGSS